MSTDRIALQRPFWKTPRFFLILGACVAIVAADWVITGIIIGVVLALPIVATSLGDDEDESRVILLVSIVGFALAHQFGKPPVTPVWVWASNRIISLAALTLAYIVARKLRRLRQGMEAERNRALASSHLNRLLISLVAHDLRSPLALAGQTLDYLSGALARGDAPDATLLRDVRWRIQRSVDDSERLVQLAQLELERGEIIESLVAVPLRHQIEREIDVFATEARAAGKTLRPDVAIADDIYEVDTVVLRHLLGVLIENAIVHADAGEILINAGVKDGVLKCTVRDPGPGDGNGAPHGMGKGLRLAQLIAERYGGAIEQYMNGSGGAHTLTLPVRALSDDGST